MQTQITYFEKVHSFNPLVAWLHSLRYKDIIKVFAKMQKKLGNRPIRVLEFGCAHAKLFSVLNAKFNIEYTGIEIQKYYADIAKQRYQNHKNFKIINDSACNTNVLKSIERPDIIVAFETFEHIPEHDVVRIIEAVAEIRPYKFVCSVPVEVGFSVFVKNFGSFFTGYIRHKEYTFVETIWAGLGMLHKLPPHGTRHKGFDWRWLAQTVRHNFKIVRLKKLPSIFLPFNIFIESEPY